MSRQLRRCRLSRCRNPPTSMSRLGRSDWISYIVHGEGIVATDPGPIMNLSLPAEIQRLIEDRVRSGKYPTPEDVTPRPNNPYGITKLGCEQLQDTYAAGWKLLGRIMCALLNAAAGVGRIDVVKTQLVTHLEEIRLYVIGFQPGQRPPRIEIGGSLPKGKVN